MPVWELFKMTFRDFPGITQFFRKTRAGNGNSDRNLRAKALAKFLIEMAKTKPKKLI